MVSSNPEDGNKPRVKSLADLPQEIAPPRDLWPQIEASLPPRKRGGLIWPSRMQLLAVAAAIATLGIGIWIGRSLLPALPGAAGSNPAVHAPEIVRAAYVNDPGYLRERAELIRSLEARLAALPPDSQAKVMASLDTIRKSMKDIEAALGRDPGNALLQELLVNTYQDEMRVLTAVQEASDAGEEI